MLQFTAHAAIQLAASGHPCIIFKSVIGGFTRKGRHCECGAAITAALLVSSGHHCINSPSPICAKNVSQENEITVNVAPPEPLSNRRPKAIYPSYPIRVKKVSLDKGPDREFSVTRIMTKETGRIGRHPVKRNSCQQNKFPPMSATAEIHRWALPVFRYPRNVLIYHYPPIRVIFMVILHVFIIKNYPNLFSNYYHKYTIWVIYPFILSFGSFIYEVALPEH